MYLAGMVVGDVAADADIGDAGGCQRASFSSEVKFPRSISWTISRIW